MAKVGWIRLLCKATDEWRPSDTTPASATLAALVETGGGSVWEDQVTDTHQVDGWLTHLVDDIGIREVFIVKLVTATSPARGRRP